MRWGLIIKGLFFLMLTAFIISCSVRSNYKTLNFFFDGVADPRIADSIALADSLKNSEAKSSNSFEVVKSEFVFHPPYKEKECGICHNRNSMGKLTEPMPGLCYQCHDNFSELYIVLHGPVDAGFCTECHNPHMNKNENLLIRHGQELCLYCHNSEDIVNSEAHSDIEDTFCTECHNPHGGEDRYIFN